MAEKNVTMSDIAKDMGVSTVTVSKAITGKDGVSKEVRDKILARAREIGYIYSKAPKEEAQKRYNVGIIVGENFIDDKDTFYIKMYQKVMLELTEQNHFSMFEIIKRFAKFNIFAPVAELKKDLFSKSIGKYISFGATLFA